MFSVYTHPTCFVDLIGQYVVIVYYHQYGRLCNTPSKLVICYKNSAPNEFFPSPFVGVFAGRHLTTQSVLYYLKYPPGVSAIALPYVELRTDGGPIKVLVQYTYTSLSWCQFDTHSLLIIMIK